MKKNIIQRIKAFFILLKADRELRRAIRLADEKYHQNGRRYYVIPNTRHELKAYSYADIKRMRRAGLFSTHATQTAFLHESFYYTPDQFGTGSLTPMQRKQKRRAWLNYVAQIRKLL